MAGTLKSEYGHARKEKRHHSADCFYKCGIVCEHSCDKFGEGNHKQVCQGEEREHNYHGIFKAEADTVCVALAVIVADYRNKALCKAAQRHGGKLHCALHYRKGADVYIAVCAQRAVEDEADKTFRTCHYKRGDSECEQRADYFYIGLKIFWLYFQSRFVGYLLSATQNAKSGKPRDKPK